MVATSTGGIEFAPGALSPVPDWKGPTPISMNIFVPQKLSAKPAIVTLLHGCGMPARMYYSGTTAYQTLAETEGHILIYPETTLDSRCWDVGSQKSLIRDQGGDSQSVAGMVRYVLAKYPGTSMARSFATGTSSGGMMTNVLLATYPDVFAGGGASFSGVAYACIAGTRIGSSPTSDTSGCGQGKVIHSAQEWGDLVRKASPNFTGERPKIAIWHGTADTLVRPQNMIESMKQWSNVFGVSLTKNITNDPVQGYTKMIYGDGTKLVGYSAAGVGHVVPQNPKAVIKWWGLDAAT